METIWFFCDVCNKESYRPSIDSKITDSNEMLERINLNFITRIVLNHSCRICLSNMGKIEEFQINNTNLRFNKEPYYGVCEITNFAYIETFNIFNFSTGNTIEKLDKKGSCKMVSFEDFCDSVKDGCIICEDASYPFDWRKVNEFFVTNNFILERITGVYMTGIKYHKYLVRKLLLTKRAI